MKKILSIIGVIAVAAIAIAVSRMSPPAPAQPDAQPASAAPLTAAEQKQVEQAKQAVVSAPQAVRYTHPRLGFSFEKPEGYTIGSIGGDGGSETLVVQPTSGNVKQGFQVYITPLDEPIDLTPATIKQQLPGTSVTNAQKITLDGGAGIMFASNNDAFNGKSYEIWFSKNGNLYQVSSYGEFASRLQQIIGTWKF